MTTIKGINDTISIKVNGKEKFILVPFPFLGVKVKFDDSSSIHAYYTHDQWVIYLTHRGYERGAVHFCTLNETTDVYTTTATPTEITVIRMCGIERDIKFSEEEI